VFLTHLLSKHFPHVVVEHEPFPSRYEMLLGNLGNDLGIGKGLARRIFHGTRRKRLKSLAPDGCYVEINPLLCPILEFLPELNRPLNVVHMVREPLSWAKSISRFKASRYVRPFIDLIPFNSPYPTPRPPGWRHLDTLKQQLWRWRYCNEQILKYRESYTKYCLVRYEDLFSEETKTRQRSIENVLDTLQIASDGKHVYDSFSQRINASPEGREPSGATVVKVREICGDLMSTFGYA
jgi:hypothetical protein